MTQWDRPGRRSVSPLVLGLVGVALLAAIYPLAADETQQPLAIFVIPLLVTATLGSWRHTAIVGAAAFAVALIEGMWGSDLDAVALGTRMAIIGITAGAATLGSFQRERHQRVIDESQSRRVVLDTLQDSLVPAPLPPAGVAVEVRYVPGDERLMFGGDFFDAIALPTGALGYVIGDVCGHGPRAAAFGAAVRSGWKALATVHPSAPLEWVRGLNETFFRLGRHADTYVTINAGVVDLERLEWRFVSAGHPWPIVITDDAVTMVRPKVGPPLGLLAHPEWHESHMVLGQDATVLLYTDGLTENDRLAAGGTLAGEHQLLAYLERQRRTLSLDALIDEFGPDGFHDDVAVLSLAFAPARSREPSSPRVDVHRA